MRLIDADWLLAKQNLYSFKDRNDLEKFINDAPTITMGGDGHGNVEYKMQVKLPDGSIGYVKVNH